MKANERSRSTKRPNINYHLHSVDHHKQYYHIDIGIRKLDPILSTNKIASKSPAQKQVKISSKLKTLSIENPVVKNIRFTSNQNSLEKFSGWETNEVIDEFLFTNLNNTGNL